MNERLSGTELENWYKRFAQEKGIAARSIPSAGKVVAAINRHIPERLKRAMPFIAKDIPDGWEQVTTLQEKPNAILPKDKDAKISDYLLDKAVATDQLIEIKNESGRFVRIAVDVTGNPEKLQEKIDRIQGFPEPNDVLGKNRNLNIAKAREELAIDKHLILALNSQREKLPSYEKLLTEMQAFANAPEETRLTDLQIVQPSELFYAEPRFLQDPQRLLNIYSENATQKQPGPQLVEIATQAIQDGHPKERVEAIIIKHSFFDDYRQKNQLPTAQKLASNVYENQAAAQQTTAQALETKPQKITPQSWPEIASALGKPQQYQTWVQEKLGGELSNVGDRAFKQDAADFQKALKQLQDWRKSAQILGKSDADLQRIEALVVGFQEGQPVPKNANQQMEADFNKVRYQQLQKAMPGDQQNLPAMAAEAFRQGYNATQVTGILSAAPSIKDIRKHSGEEVSQSACKMATLEGLKLNGVKNPKASEQQQPQNRPRQR